MPRRILKDHAAERDLIDIWVYTHENWGERQADAYLDALARGIAILAVRPEQGVSRESLLDGYWSRRIEHHVVFYTFSTTEIRIRRVLHESMDFLRHLAS